jgi:two-component system response regulator FixJ
MSADQDNNNAREPTGVSIVDPDLPLARRLAELLGGVGADVSVFPDAETFLAAPPGALACVISALQLPGINGIELIGELRGRGIRAPVILLAGDGNVETAVSAIRAGALDFIEKPHVDRLLAWHVARLLERGPPVPD